jgi:hypothetical protein
MKHDERSMPAPTCSSHKAPRLAGMAVGAPRSRWFLLVPAVVDLAAPVPVLAAGGIADGRDLAAALALGAAGALVGWTLHRLRHSALTHDAEGGTSTPMLLARSRHASVRSLERYARPGIDAVARHVAGRDPAARRRG